MVTMSSVWSIRRSTVDKKLAGVCGGVARHWNVDPVLVRVGWVLLALSGGVGIVLYVAAWLLVPADGATSSTMDDLTKGSTRGWPREAWVAIVAIACLITFGIFSSTTTIGFGPAVVLALIWYFGYYKTRVKSRPRRRPRSPDSRRRRLHRPRPSRSATPDHPPRSPRRRRPGGSGWTTCVAAPGRPRRPRSRRPARRRASRPGPARRLRQPLLRLQWPRRRPGRRTRRPPARPPCRTPSVPRCRKRSRTPTSWPPPIRSGCTPRPRHDRPQPPRAAGPRRTRCRLGGCASRRCCCSVWCCSVLPSPTRSGCPSPR